VIGLRESALILPVPEAESLVGPWREQYDDSARTGVPAHVTLLYPFLSPEEIGPADLRQLSELFASVPATTLRLVSAQRFSRGVLYLVPEPEAFVRALTNRIWALYPQRPPYRGAFENVIPHLTVAQHDDHAVLDGIEAAVTPALPIVADVREAWLMLQAADEHWRAGHIFPLG
jgi:2'-5' RNA ligase